MEMFIVPDDETHPDNCDSGEQQAARIIRRWAADPEGTNANGMTNERILAVKLEFMMESILRRAANPRFREYWSDGVKRLDAERIGLSGYRFTGVTIWSDLNCDHEWFAPFEFRIDYDHYDADFPRRMILKFGFRDVDGDVRRVPLGDRNDRERILSDIMATKPTVDSDWAVIVSLDPYYSETRADQ